MTYTFKLARRLSINHFSLMIAPLLLLSACTGGEPTEASTIELARGGIKGSPFVDLTITPSAATLKPNEKRLFVAKGVRNKGDTVVVSVTWTATGGQISPTGEYSAGPIPGNYQVVGTQNDSRLADTSAVTISTTTQTPTLSGVILTPVSASLAPGAAQQFAAVGKYSDSTTAPIDVTYTATGGTVTSGGMYTAGEASGTFRVIATDQITGLADTSAVTIGAPLATLEAVVLTPASVTLQSGATQQFSVSGRMSDGSATSVNATYSATGGTITSGGLYTAGSSAGTFRVVATQQGGTKADTSAVSITTPATAPSPPQAGDLPTPLRTINVATTAALDAAIRNALPGDRIVMASGSYGPLGDWYNGVTRSGTATNPIVLTGPRTAVLTGTHFLVTASYWIFNGFRITNSNPGAVSNIGGNYNIYEYLEMDHTGGAAIAIKTAMAGSYSTAVVTGNVIRYNHIHHTGLGRDPIFGEGIYIGDGSCKCQVVRGTHIHHNNIHDTTTEGIELKEATSGSIVEFNTITNAGTAGIVGSQDPIHVGSTNNQINDNTITTWQGSSAISTGTGGNGLPSDASGNTYRRNTGTNAAGGNLFKFEAGHSGNVVYCDNNPVAPTILGVTCTR